jgi:hypothetical protein
MILNNSVKKNNQLLTSILKKMKRSKLGKLAPFVMQSNQILGALIGGLQAIAEPSVDTKKKDVDSEKQDSASGDHYD